MAQKKIDSNSFSRLINEHVEADRRMSALQEEVDRIDSFMERYNAGEEITEEELNEFLGGLGAVGKWGRKKASDAASATKEKLGQVGQQAWDTAKGAAADVKHQYQKGQRASAINKQRKAVDKQQAANSAKVQKLAVDGKKINDAIKKYRIALANIGAEYEKLTGKKYVPGRAVANAQRYIDESQN